MGAVVGEGIGMEGVVAAVGAEVLVAISAERLTILLGTVPMVDLGEVVVVIVAVAGMMVVIAVVVAVGVVNAPATTVRRVGTSLGTALKVLPKDVVTGKLVTTVVRQVTLVGNARIRRVSASIEGWFQLKSSSPSDH